MEADQVVHALSDRSLLNALPARAPTDLYGRSLFGEAIRSSRKKAGFSQEKLAEKADLHPVYISAVERGAKTISMDTLMRIAKALGLKMRELTHEL